MTSFLEDLDALQLQLFGDPYEKYYKEPPPAGYHLRVKVLWKGAKDFVPFDLMKLPQDAVKYFFVQKTPNVSVGEFWEDRTEYPFRFDKYDVYFRAEWWKNIGLPRLGRYFVEVNEHTSKYQRV